LFLIFPQFDGKSLMRSQLVMTRIGDAEEFFSATAAVFCVFRAGASRSGRELVRGAENDPRKDGHLTEYDSVSDVA
jgi:hypothetical protein